MRRLGAVLLLILLVPGMNVRSVWSGGGKWGDGSPAGDRTDAYWLPDGQTPTGRPFPDVAIGGTLIEDALQSASWSLGPSDYLADLSPSTASLQFVGQIDGTPGDEVVITSAVGAQWSGRLDTATQTRDVNGDWWTTITATDRVGALGAAELFGYTYTPELGLEELVEGLSSDAGITLDLVDVSTRGLALFSDGPAGFSGSALDIINQAARSSNAMLGMGPDGRLYATVREHPPGGGVNGEFESSVYGVTEWAAYAGGSIAHSTTTPLSGTGDAHVTCTTTQYSGAVYSLAGDIFRAGKTYRLSVNTELISGEDHWYIRLYSADLDDYDGSDDLTLFTATGTPTVRTFDFTPAIDVDDVELYVGAYDAVPVAGVLAIDNVRVYEVPVDLTGDLAPQSWSLATNVDGIVNIIYNWEEGAGAPLERGTGGDSLPTYGKRVFDAAGFEFADATPYNLWEDWNFYQNTTSIFYPDGTPPLPTASGQFVVSSWDQDDLLLMRPFQWFSESGTDWQVMSVQHSVSANPYSWNVTVTFDNLLANLRRVP